MTQFKWLFIFLAFFFNQNHVKGEFEPSKRIINGYHAIPKQFPYQVYFDQFINYNWKPNCGGVIISSRIILTAAHCVNDEFDAIKIYFGAVDKSNIREVGQQRLIVKQENIIVHPEYQDSININDIALIKLPADLQFDDYIQAAKLPESDKLYENEEGVVSGWGLTSVPSNEQQQKLLYYNVTVLSNEDCKRLINYQGRFFPSSYICLKPSGSTPCNGDSGGPLAIRNEDGSSTLLGLTSFVIGICPLNSPAIYTRVSSFLPWIKQYE